MRSKSLINSFILVTVVFIMVPDYIFLQVHAQEPTEEFTFSYSSNTGWVMPSFYFEGGLITSTFKEIKITYGDNNFFTMSILDEPSEGTGFAFAVFDYYDVNNNNQKVSYELNSIDLDYWNGTDPVAINFAATGDFNWLKENIGDFSEDKWYSNPSGIINLNITTPKKVIVNNRTELQWAIQYKLGSTLKDLNGTVQDWNINSSINLKYTYHFYIENQSARLKIDQELADFNLEPMVKNPVWLSSTNMHSWYTIHLQSTAQPIQWVIDGQEISSTGITGGLAANATIFANAIPVTEINFGKSYDIKNISTNDTQTKDIETMVWLDVKQAQSTDSISYGQGFNGFNATPTTKIVMDPEIGVFFRNFSTTKSTGLPKSTSIPATTYFNIEIMIITTLGVILWRRRKIFQY